MDRKRMGIMTAALLSGLVILLSAGYLIVPITNAESGAAVYSDLHVDSMHPWIASEGPGKCSICGMKLSQVQGHRPGTTLPAVDNLYVTPSNPMWVHEGPGEHPETGEQLIPIKQSPYYQAPVEDHAEDHDQSGMSMQESPAAVSHSQEGDEAQLYTCGMHPDVIQDEPGTCPICSMNLTPIRGSGRSSTTGEREIAYWVAPMDPGFISDTPGKSPMGMDLVPVYADQLSEGTVQIDPVTLQSIGVRTEPATMRDLARSIRSNGIVKVAEDSEFKLNARISGWVERLHVSRTGDRVVAGQPLLDIYSPQLVSAQKDLLLAMRSGSSSSSRLVAAVRQRLRFWNISEAQIDELAGTGQIRQSLTLTSPGTGIVLHKNVVEGSSVSAGMDLFRIADLETLWVIAQIYEYEVPWISIGDKVEIRSPYDPGLTVTGTLSFIYPTLDTRSRTVELRIVIPNPDLRFKPEMYVDVTIQTSSREDVVAVPKSAVIRTGERDLVFVQRGQGRFEPVEVHLGLEAGRYYEIAHGLQAGEEVVVSAQFLLDSEAKLQEAIQRRIQQRKQPGKSNPVTTETSPGSQHQH
ncbi:MAG: efflux RND transporter periplasmic adaptor subunit [Candidatus Delongbacteria bacterium]|nr:efflux RND transporter periplasmic adaptor subunit [Candidatus Delongbacteria bacterium]